MFDYAVVRRNQRAAALNRRRNYHPIRGVRLKSLRQTVSPHRNLRRQGQQFY